MTVAPQARHDWLLVVDPDEEVPPALADGGRRGSCRRSPTTSRRSMRRGSTTSRGRRLRGTVWGGPNKRRLLVHRGRVELTPTIWGGMRIAARASGWSSSRSPTRRRSSTAGRAATASCIERHRRYLEARAGRPRRGRRDHRLARRAHDAVAELPRELRHERGVPGRPDRPLALALLGGLSHDRRDRAPARAPPAGAVSERARRGDGDHRQPQRGAPPRRPVAGARVLRRGDRDRHRLRRTTPSPSPRLTVRA